MPVPIAGAILGSAALGAFGASRAASAQASAANSAAEASAYATDRSIAASEKARAEANAAARRGNKLATKQTIRGAHIARKIDNRGSAATESVLLASNKASADKLTANAKAATDATVSANLGNIDFFKKIWGDTATSLKPWRDAGSQAITALSKGAASGAYSMDGWNFQADPSYEFRRQQGQQALDRSAAAAGGLLSGRQLAATADYNSNLASTEYAAAYAREAANRQNKFGNLLTLADRGQQAVQDTNAARSTLAERVGGANLNIGGARSTFYTNQGQIRGAEAATRGNILATGIADRTKFATDAVRTATGARAQGALNIANTAALGAGQVGQTAAQAYQQQGVTQGNAALAAGEAKANAWAGMTGAVGNGLGNWLTYKMAGIG